MGYVTHSDPGGKTSSWVTNKISTILAPQLIKKLHKACQAYPSWKQQHSPSMKHWLYPEQIKSPRINIVTDVICFIASVLSIFISMKLNVLSFQCVKPADTTDGTESPEDSVALEELVITDSDDENNDFS